MKIDPRFAETLRTARHEAGITQQDLAVLIGCHVSTIAKWEAATGYPAFGEYLELCRLFGWPHLMIPQDPPVEIDWPVYNAS